MDLRVLERKSGAAAPRAVAYNYCSVVSLKELGYNVVLATGRGFAMPPGVPKDAAATMEAALKRVHDTPGYREYAERNMLEDAWLGSADFARPLVEQRAEQIEFLKAIGVVK